MTELDMSAGQNLSEWAGGRNREPSSSTKSDEGLPWRGEAATGRRRNATSVAPNIARSFADRSAVANLRTRQRARARPSCTRPLGTVASTS